MIKFKVVDDPNNKPRFSSRIITESLNNAAKSLGLFDDNGVVCSYDGVCNSHAARVDAFICTYEISFPEIILKNAGGKPIIGVSKDNQRFIIEGGYPVELTDWFLLGVNAETYPEVKKTRNLDKFVVGVYTESLVRGGVELAVEYLGQLYGGSKDFLLEIKDRNATPLFENWVRERAKHYDLQINYLNCHFSTIREITEWFSGIDCHLYLNRSSTFAMPPAESMCMGVPTIAPAYSGPREFIINGYTGINCEYNMRYVDEEMAYLMQIGTRNFFFGGGYADRPVWAVPTLEGVSKSINEVMTKKYPNLSLNGRNFAQTLTWERAAANLSTILSK